MMADTDEKINEYIEQCCQSMNKVHRFVNFLFYKWTFYEHEKIVNFLWTF